MNVSIPSDLAEQSEAEALFEVETGVPRQTAVDLGMEAIRVGGGIALSMRNDSTQFWSRAMGFGFQEQITAGLIKEVCDFFRSESTPVAILQLAPAVLPDDWADICAEMNLSAGSNWLKLARDLNAPVGADTPEMGLGEGLRVGKVAASQAEQWAGVMLRTFGMPEEGLTQMVASSVGVPSWHPYGVWDGGDIVATATMHVHRDAAQFFGGATTPHARRRGAQSALIAARVEAARTAGCRWLVAETGAEAPGEHNPSLHNLQRAGFSVIYERRNWIFRP